MPDFLPARANSRAGTWQNPGFFITVWEDSVIGNNKPDVVRLWAVPSQVFFATVGVTNCPLGSISTVAMAC